MTLEFPPTATVVIGINEITKGEHGHSDESEEGEHAAATRGWIDKIRSRINNNITNNYFLSSFYFDILYIE